MAGLTCNAHPSLQRASAGPLVEPATLRYDADDEALGCPRFFDCLRDRLGWLHSVDHLSGRTWSSSLVCCNYLCSNLLGVGIQPQAMLDAASSETT